MLALRQMNSSENFNSIKVRLELDLSHRHMFTAQIFQFHKGTIRTFRTLNNFCYA